MTDIFDAEKRSEIMSQIRGSNNRSTEDKLIALFRAYNIKGWCRKYKIFGKPDFVFHKQRIAIFVDGCFWHGHDCRNTRPKQNDEFWLNKISRNMQRDAEVTRHLEELRWKVFRIWECELKQKNRPKLLERLSQIHLYEDRSK